MPSVRTEGTRPVYRHRGHHSKSLYPLYRKNFITSLGQVGLYRDEWDIVRRNDRFSVT